MKYWTPSRIVICLVGLPSCSVPTLADFLTATSTVGESSTAGSATTGQDPTTSSTDNPVVSTSSTTFDSFVSTEPVGTTSGGDTTTGATSLSSTDTSTGESTSLTSGDVSTGATPSCGDGIVDNAEKCDDGNDISGDGCSDLCVPEILAFVTSEASYSGGLLPGEADKKCNDLAKAANLPGAKEGDIPSTNYRALRDSLSLLFNDADAPIYRLDGQLVGTLQSIQMSKHVENAISITDKWTTVTESPLVWTGMNNDGTVAVVNCLGWTQGIHGATGAVGKSTDYLLWANIEKITEDEDRCDNKYRFYCVRIIP